MPEPVDGAEPRRGYGGDAEADIGQRDPATV